MLEDHAENPEFGYFELKAELLGHFTTAESDYEVIREIIERKQTPQETFEEFYSDVNLPSQETDPGARNSGYY